MKEILRHAHIHLISALKHLKDQSPNKARADIKLADAIIWKMIIKEAKDGKSTEKR